MENVLLKYLEHRGKTWIQVEGPAGLTFNELMKKSGGQFTITYRSWLFPYTRAAYEKLITALDGHYSTDISHLKKSVQLKNKFQELQKKKTENKAIKSAAVKPVMKSEDAKENITINLNRNAFEEYKKMLLLKGYSRNTIRNYCIELRVLLRLLGEKKKLDELSKDDIHRYLLWLIIHKSYGESQVNTAVNAIKFYFEQVKYQGRMIFDLPRPKKPWVLPAVHDQQKVKMMITQTENIKHKTMLMLAYGCGLRISEIIAMKIESIDSARMVIMIKRAKGKKDRLVTLPALLLEQLRKYYKQYRPKEWLFEGQGGEQYGYRSLQLVFQQAKNRAGVKIKGGIHSLRHSYATHLMEKGTDIRVIQELLGHNSIKTTMRYTHVSRAQISKIKSPLDDLKL